MGGPFSRLGPIAVALVAAAIALPAPALGAAGETKMRVEVPAAAALGLLGVRIAPLKPAHGGSRTIALPAAAGLAGTATTLLRHRGGISLEAPNGRKARLTSLRLLLGERSVLEATLGGEEIDLFKVLRGGRREISPASGRVQLGDLRLRLTRPAASALAARLGLKALSASRFGSLSTDLSGLIRGDGGKATGAGGDGPVAPGGGSPAPKPTSCPLPSSAGPSADGAPPLALRPAGAVDVTAATVDWHVRESFIRYIATGEGTSPTDGATADPPVLLPGASAALSYDFHFPFASGWLDPGADPSSAADDSAALYFSGGLRFHYSGHGIDLAASAPEIELAGGNSRAIFAVSENGAAAERQVLVNLDLGRAGAITQSGSSYTYDRVPAAIPAGTASSTFAGFYAPGTDFGCFSVSFSTG
jgi:hypothetical protein